MGLEVGIREATDEGFMVAEQNWGSTPKLIVKVPDSLVQGIKFSFKGCPFLS